MNAITRWVSRAMPLLALTLLTSLCLLAPAQARGGDKYVVRYLVSDGTVPNTTNDPKLVNPWGIAFNPNGFVWVRSSSRPSTG